MTSTSGTERTQQQRIRMTAGKSAACGILLTVARGPIGAAIHQGHWRSRHNRFSLIPTGMAYLTARTNARTRRRERLLTATAAASTSLFLVPAHSRGALGEITGSTCPQ